MAAVENCTLVGKPENFTKVLDRYAHGHLYAGFTFHESINKYGNPIWMIIGLPGAVLSLIIWTRKPMRQSSSIYLAAMGLSDIFFFIFMFTFYLYVAWGFHQILNIPVVCNVFPVIYYVSQYMSPLLTLGFSVERFISICFPFRRDQLCSTSRAIKTTIALTITALLIASVQASMYQMSPSKECVERQDVFDKTATWFPFFFSYNLISELFIFGIVPIAILVINLMVIKELRSVAARNPITLDKPKGGGSGSSQSAATTMMLLCVSFYFIIACLPCTICQIILQVVKDGKNCLTWEEIPDDPGWIVHFRFINTRAILQWIAISNYAAKFYIYLATGKMFRRQLIALCPPLFKLSSACCHKGSTASPSIDHFSSSTSRRKPPNNSAPVEKEKRDPFDGFERKARNPFKHNNEINAKSVYSPTTNETSLETSPSVLILESSANNNNNNNTYDLAKNGTANCDTAPTLQEKETTPFLDKTAS